MPIAARSQVSDFAVSDSIWNQLHVLGRDSFIEITQSFYDSNAVIYTAIFSVAGSAFKGLSSDAEPQWFAPNDETLTRCFVFREIDNWIGGNCSTNYTGTTFSNLGAGRQATITISGDTWQGVALDDTNAFARAFLQFLLDPDFATYLF